jgi:hypothetical protein
MKKVVRLTESDLVRIVKRVISEETTDTSKQKIDNINLKYGHEYFFKVFSKDGKIIKYEGKPAGVAMSVQGSIGNNNYNLASTENYQFPELKDGIYTYKQDVFTLPYGLGRFTMPGTSYYLALSHNQLK